MPCRERHRLGVDESDKEAVRRLLSPLRKGDLLAQSEACELLYGPVFRTLLHWGRRLNSHYGGPLPDPDIQDLTHELTAEAFMSAFARMNAYDESRSSLMTFVAWRGRALMNGVVLKEIRAALRNAPAAANTVPEDETSSAEPRSLDNVEDEVLARLGLREIEAILQAMPADQALAILEVWIRPRPRPRETPITAAARVLGRSDVAMDSLLRRATKRFRQLWLERAGGANGEGVR